MPIGAQPFDLPINAVKKETSLQDKILIQSHNEDGTDIIFYDKIVDRRIHTKSVKVKFFVVGYRPLSQGFINYIGRWVELEPHQLDYFYPLAPVASSSNGITDTYFLGFYPYVVTPDNELHIRFQLFPFPNNNVPAELYIEKLTVVDSDFDADLSWLTDPDIPPIVPPITGPIDPPDPPFGIDPDPNCQWPFG